MGFLQWDSNILYEKIDIPDTSHFSFFREKTSR